MRKAIIWVVLILLLAFSLNRILDINLLKNRQLVSVSNEVTLCLLFGTFSDLRGRRNVGLSSLGDMIRLRFDAESTEDCKELAIHHCQKNILKGYLPKELSLLMRVQSSRERQFRFMISRECLLQVPTIDAF